MCSYFLLQKLPQKLRVNLFPPFYSFHLPLQKRSHEDGLFGNQCHLNFVSNEISVYHTMAGASFSALLIQEEKKLPSLNNRTSSQRLAVTEQQCIKIIHGDPKGNISHLLSALLHAPELDKTARKKIMAAIKLSR